MANKLDLFRNGAVDFIDWLDRRLCMFGQPTISTTALQKDRISDAGNKKEWLVAARTLKILQLTACVRDRSKEH